MTLALPKSHLLIPKNLNRKKRQMLQIFPWEEEKWQRDGSLRNWNLSEFPRRNNQKPTSCSRNEFSACIRATIERRRGKTRARKREKERQRSVLRMSSLRAVEAEAIIRPRIRTVAKSVKNGRLALERRDYY